MKKLIFIILPILLLAACSGDAIFHTLENEEKIEDNNNFKDGTPTIDFDQMGGYYITHGKNLWASIEGASNDWEKMPLPSGYSSEATVPSMAIFNGALYATAIDHDSNYRSGLLKASSPAGSLSEQFRYEKVDSSVDDFEFYLLKLFPVDGGNGLYITRERRSWSNTTSNGSVLQETELYYYSSAQAANLDNGLDPGNIVSTGYTGFTVQGAVFDGTDYYIAINNISASDKYDAGKLLYGSASATSLTEITPSIEDATYNQIYYTTLTGGEKLILISLRQDNGRYHKILYNLNSGGWKSIGYDSRDVQFSAFCNITGLVDDMIMVGTRADAYAGSSSYYYGDGYYLIDFSDTSSPSIGSNTTTIATNYSSTDLREATITDIYFDNSGSGRLYITTSAEGLWLNSLTDDGDRKWSRE